MSKIGANLRKIRVIKGLSQVQFAKIFNLTRASIGAYEEGRAEPKIETAIEIAKYFSISLDELFTKNITVNQLANFNVVIQGGDIAQTSSNMTLLNYVNSDLLTNVELLINYLNEKKELRQIEFPKWIDDADTFFDLNRMKIRGIDHKNIKALICLRIKKPVKNTNIVVVTQKNIVVGKYLDGSSEVLLKPFNSDKVEKYKGVLFFFNIKFFVTSNISTLQSLELKLSHIESHIARIDK